MFKYVRAFFIALRLTLRGQTPAPAPYTRLDAWITTCEQLVDDVYKAADRAGLDATQRKARKLRLEGRDITMEALLGGVRFHATQEYRYLLRHPTEHSLTAIYASNLNDQFRIARLREQLTEPDLQAALDGLTRHLEAIPPSNEVSGKP